mgnify:CR=1 FL=1
MLPFLLASLLMFILYRFAVTFMQATGSARLPVGELRPVRRTSAKDTEVEDAFEAALAHCPTYVTPLLEARAPCVLLLARAASGDLDAMTYEIVERLRCHIPPLVAAHCAVIERAHPHLRREAMAELVGDLRNLASPQGLCARQRFDGHNKNMGYATSLRRAMGSLSARNSPGESRFARCQR